MTPQDAVLCEGAFTFGKSPVVEVDPDGAWLQDLGGVYAIRRDGHVYVVKEASIGWMAERMAELTERALASEGDERVRVLEEAWTSGIGESMFCCASLVTDGTSVQRHGPLPLRDPASNVYNFHIFWSNSEWDATRAWDVANDLVGRVSRSEPLRPSVAFSAVLTLPRRRSIL